MSVDETPNADVAEEALEDTEVDLEDIEVTKEEAESMESDDNEESESDETEDTTEAGEEEATDEESNEESEEAEPELTEEEQQADFKRQMFERRQQEKANREHPQKEQQQKYLDEAEDNHDLALRQLQVDAYDNKVERNTNVLKNQYDTAIKDFDILRSDDPVIQNRVNKALDAFQAQNVAIDSYGNPTDIRADLYTYLQSEADDLAKLTGIRAKAQEQSKGKQKSKTLSVPSRSPKEPKVDPDMAAFDEEAYS